MRREGTRHFPQNRALGRQSTTQKASRAPTRTSRRWAASRTRCPSFSANIQQRAWHSPKFIVFTSIVAHVRGDSGISLGLFRPKLIQFMRDPSDYVISSDILRTRVGQLIRWATEPWRKIHKWVTGAKDENEIVLPHALIEECKELLFEMAAVFFVFEGHTKDNSQTLGWYIHVLSVLPARYGQIQKDFGRARDGGLAVKSLLVKHAPETDACTPRT